MTEAGGWGAVAVVILGRVESALKEANTAPLQADEGAPEAWLVFNDWIVPALQGLSVGDEVLVLTWLHLADRRVLRVHPRGDARRDEQGVFTTRSPHRPNPIGIHRTTILDIVGRRVHVAALEALDGTPILDVKAVLDAEDR